ncbi:MAG: NRDE family protein [Cyclobacteriaceae bacterium]
MCLITFAWQCHKEYPLVVLANRDEFYKRPTQPADYWEDHPHILAGRDLEAGGTWMGVSSRGRWAALTNYRDPQSILTNAPSRGELTSNFLSSDLSIKEYLSSIKHSGKVYNGFNLLVGDAKELGYYNNIDHEILSVQPGVHGLSNGLLNTAWPKVENARHKLEQSLKADQLYMDGLAHQMLDQQLADDDELPSTGVPYEWEKALSAMFISSPEYGTSITTVLRLNNAGIIDFTEHTHAVNGKEAVKKNHQLTF